MRKTFFLIKKLILRAFNKNFTRKRFSLIKKKLLRGFNKKKFKTSYKTAPLKCT